jgi:hypothetical protein
MKRFALLAAAVVLLSGLFGRGVVAAPVTQATLTLSTTDEVSVGFNPDRNEKTAYGSGSDALRFGNYLAPKPRAGRSFFRTYLRFPLTSIPSAATIVSARLEMYVHDRRFTSGGDLNAGVYRVTSGGWTEAGLSNPTNWTWTTLPGVSPIPQATSTISAVDQWYSWNVTSLVSNWVSGAWQPYGMMLSSDPVDDGNTLQDDQAVSARSRGGTPGLGPRLVVVYSLARAPAASRPSEIPEPSTLVLLGGGMAAFWAVQRSRKRRR